MSYEFYIMSGIAVFLGCTWLYRKGKGAYMMVRKIRSAFKVVNINPASSLADEQYKKLLSVRCMPHSKEHTRIL